MKMYLKLAAETALSLALMAGSAFAIPNTTQKGSLMIFPLVDVQGNNDTIIRIENDGTRTVWVECYMKNASKASSDFAFSLTRGASTSFSMVDKGFKGLTHGKLYPWPKFQDDERGELKCFAVDTNIGGQIYYNHLSGTATVVDYDRQQTFEYNSWNFRALNPPPTSPGKSGLKEGDPVGKAGTIKLDGVEYDACPQYLKFTYVKPGASEGVSPHTLVAGDTRIVVASCTQDLRQEKVPSFTKLQFTIIDANEQPLSESYDCINSWRYTALNEIDHNYRNFTDNLKTTTALVRVRGVKAKKATAPDDCWTWAEAPPWVNPGDDGTSYPQILPDWARVKDAGLVGIVLRDVCTARSTVAPLDVSPEPSYPADCNLPWEEAQQVVTDVTAVAMNTAGKDRPVGNPPAAGTFDVIRWDPERPPAGAKN